MNKISVKIIQAILFSTILAILSVSFITILNSREILREEAELNLMNLVAIEGQLINESINNIQMLCDTLTVQVRNNIELDKVANDYEAMQKFEESIVDTFTDTIEAFDLMSGWVVFDSLIIEGGHTIGIYKDNDVFIREPEYDLRDYGYETSEWYGDAVKNGETWTSPYSWELWGDTTLITYSKRLEINGEIIGVIGSEFFMDNLYDRLSKIKVYDTGYITLMDSDFNFLHHPTLGGENLRNVQDGELSVLAKDIQNSSEKTGVISYEFDGNNKLMAFYILDNGWILTANPIEKEIYTNMNTMIQRIIFVSLIALIIGLISATIQGRTIAKPLEKLASNAIKLSKGTYDNQEEIKPTKIYEIDILQNNFTVMIKNIYDREEELRQFVYVASHDLQEPLRMVTSYLQIIEKKYKGKLDEKADTYIFYAVDGAKRMKILIKDLLLYSRASSEIEFEVIDLNQIVDEVLKNFTTVMNDIGMVVHKEELPSIVGEHTRMVQLFQNLISNSVKYHNVSKPEINIRFSKIDNTYEIIIEDNGIGFKQDNASQIFEVFKRLHNADEYPGSGIGLSICKKIMEKHNGSIYAKSNINEGAKFYMRFPISEES